MTPALSVRRSPVLGFSGSLAWSLCCTYVHGDTRYLRENLGKNLLPLQGSTLWLVDSGPALILITCSLQPSSRQQCLIYCAKLTSGLVSNETSAFCRIADNFSGYMWDSRIWLMSALFQSEEKKKFLLVLGLCSVGYNWIDSCKNGQVLTSCFTKSALC